MKLAIYTAATKGYAYALDAQARKIQGALFALTEPLTVAVFIVSEGNKEAEACAELYRELLPDAEVRHLADSRFVDGHENYKPKAQLVIAQMRTMATTAARAWGADYLLAMDSDVLPPANAIRCMLDVLRFDSGYYGVAACPYPSQGGGDFLCGRGTPQNPILPDFYEDEKEVPAELLERREKLRAFLENPEDKAWDCLSSLQHHVASEDRKKSAVNELKEIEEKIRALPPREGVFGSNAKQWRQRGWFSQAYPAIGKGAMVPTDWCGFGCTMMNREAMALCDFTGYDGGGTEDLFICFHRWWPNGIRIAALPHCVADHVIRVKQEEGPPKIEHCFAGHEGQGECVGHLRQQRRAWFAHSPGEIPATI
jgi:hypothetical protein